MNNGSGRGGHTPVGVVEHGEEWGGQKDGPELHLFSHDPTGAAPPKSASHQPSVSLQEQFKWLLEEQYQRSQSDLDDQGEDK